MVPNPMKQMIFLLYLSLIIKMDLLKELLPEKNKIKSLGEVKAKKMSLPLLISMDYCSRYRPLYDKNTFE
jgi:hypothetical protein